MSREYTGSRDCGCEENTPEDYKTELYKNSMKIRDIQILDLKGELALEKSIGKWQDIARGVGADFAARNCELCKVYNRPLMFCKDCPVQKKLTRGSCLGTPYIEFVTHHEKAHPQFFDEWKKNGKVIKCEKCVQLAVKELDFLKSLRYNSRMTATEAGARLKVGYDFARPFRSEQVRGSIFHTT